MTEKMYLSDRSRTGRAIITAVVEGDRPIIRLNRTWFHPQGGGQKADRGEIDGKTVLHVKIDDQHEVNHYVDNAEGLKSGMTVSLQVDESWRRLNECFHTAGHLVACVAEPVLDGAVAVYGHQWPGEARVEFEGFIDGLLSRREQLIAEINERLIKSIIENWHVRMIDSCGRRAIQIGDMTPIPCGGTHIQSLSDLSSVTVTALKKKQNVIRASYAAVPKLSDSSAAF